MNKIVFLTQKISHLNLWRRIHIPNNLFLLVMAALIGLLGGLLAALLKLVTHQIEAYLENGLDWKYKLYLFAFFPIIGITLSVIFIKTVLKGKSFYRGLGQIKNAIETNRSQLPAHNIFSQLITSAVTIGFGGSAGLEAPVATAGASVGSNLARLLKMNYRETTLFLACGAAAAIAGAFNSPIAGVVFAIEILLPEFTIPAFIPLLISAAIAATVGNILFPKSLFVLVTNGWDWHSLFFYFIMAVGIGLFSNYYIKLSVYLSNLFKKISKERYKIIIGGVSLGLLIAIFPILYGEGYITIQHILDGKYNTILNNSLWKDYQDVPWVLLLTALLSLFGKSISSLLTILSGGNGGTFGPSLVMGALFGFVFSYGLNMTGLVELNVTNFTVAGMAAAISGIMQAPMTGIFLIAEITGGYILMAPLMLVSALSYAISKTNSFRDEPIIQKDLDEDKYNQKILNRMKASFCLDTKYTMFLLTDTLLDRKKDIILSQQNIYPIIDEHKQLKGVISAGNLLENIIDQNGKLDQITMASIMQPVIEIIQPNTSVETILQKLEQYKMASLPVANKKGEFLGFVTKTTIFTQYRDVLKHLAHNNLPTTD